jgi:signal transduction histidine kinase
MQRLTNSPNWPNYLYLGLRILTIILLPILIIFVRYPTLEFVEFSTDIAVAIAISIVVTIVLAAFIFIKQLRDYTIYVGTIGDWIIAGSYVALTNGRPLEQNLDMIWIIAVASLLVLNGGMRLGPWGGRIHSVGTIVSAAIGLMFTQRGFNPSVLLNNPLKYVPAVIVVGGVALMSSIWVVTLERLKDTAQQDLRKQMGRSTARLKRMDERNKAIAEMTATLNKTLRYEAVLNAALNVGRLSLRKNQKQRFIGMVLLFTFDNRLEVMGSQGTARPEIGKQIDGKYGIVADCLEEGLPRIGKLAQDDPELSKINSFFNIESTLCIPLQAGFDTYGVLLFGSDRPNAFNSDHLDTMRSIGTQATVALQNAMLYQNLMNEKERIIEIEESARKALVRDLHDVPTQTISAVTMRLGIIPKMIERDMGKEKILEEVTEIREMASRATQEIRHVLFTLRPLALESQGLGEAINQLANKMQETYKQNVIPQIVGDAERYLEKSQQGTLFYLIEEAVNNARKYANASQVRVVVTRQGDFVVVQVIDNGKGFDASNAFKQSEKQGSFGMVNMKERAELIDGIFEIDSRPGRGTTVTVTVPVHVTEPIDEYEEEEEMPTTKLEATARRLR